MQNFLLVADKFKGSKNVEKANNNGSYIDSINNTLLRNVQFVKRKFFSTASIFKLHMQSTFNPIFVLCKY